VTQANDAVGGVLSVAILAIVAMLIIPLPPVLLDILLAFDIMFATAVLVIALSIRNPLELAAFPALLLVTTLFRLSLDVSATRLILTQGDQPGGAGSVIPAFGEFVMQGNIAVGALMIVILIVVQLVVVSNGAQRVAEVAARFTLDAMPGKQMAIDAELHTGVIDATQAQARRKAVQAEADFYGAMDGAGKFVRGDAIASVIIVGINVVAGMAIGTLGKHLDIITAAQTYPLLSIGNALATTLPAFLLSTAMGIMVTRAASEATLGVELGRQVLAHPGALQAVGVAMIGFALVPGLPHVAFGMLGCTSLAAASWSLRAQRSRQQAQSRTDAQTRRAQEYKPEHALSLLSVDALAIHVGEKLLSILEQPAADALLGRIAALRRHVVLDLGIVMPGVAVQDDLRLAPKEFAIHVRGRAVAHGSLEADRPLALGDAKVLSHLPGEAYEDPASRLQGVWLAHDGAVSHQQADHTAVIDPLSVLTTALHRVVWTHAATLLGRQEVQFLLDNLKQAQPAAVKGVVPELVSLGLVQRVLQHLVRERISVRDMASIVETIAEEAENTRDVCVIGESVRRKLAPTICASLANADGTIQAAALSLSWESRLAAATVNGERGPVLGLEPQLAARLAVALRSYEERAFGKPTLVCSQSLRLPLARFVESYGGQLSLLGLGEIVPGYTLHVTETIIETET
jgi:flagellar biosynthesis protein FlhA